MKKPISFILAGLFLVASSGALWATVFTLSATVPTAASVSITPSLVTPGVCTAGVQAPPVFDKTFPASSTALAFGTLNWDATNKIFTASKYYAIDVANMGAGSPNVTVSYAEGLKPSGQTAGLGDRAVATFMKAVYKDPITPGGDPSSTDTSIAAHNGDAGKKLTGLNESVLASETTGGWLRVNVGVSTGATCAGLALDAKPFTATDKIGNYTGTLTVTGTVG